MMRGRATVRDRSARRHSRHGAGVLLALLLGFFAGLSDLQAQQAAGELRGEIRSHETGQTLPGAMLELVTGSIRSIAISDARGRYEFPEVPAGRSRLHVRSL